MLLMSVLCSLFTLLVCFFMVLFFLLFFFMQKTAYEMRISDCSSAVCSSDLRGRGPLPGRRQRHGAAEGGEPAAADAAAAPPASPHPVQRAAGGGEVPGRPARRPAGAARRRPLSPGPRQRLARAVAVVVRHRLTRPALHRLDFAGFAALD